eukprot:scaffold60_cov325-Pavlova_lutheri.AAC.24
MPPPCRGSTTRAWWPQPSTHGMRRKKPKHREGWIRAQPSHPTSTATGREDDEDGRSKRRGTGRDAWEEGWTWHRVHACHGVIERVARHLPRAVAESTPGGDAIPSMGIGPLPPKVFGSEPTPRDGGRIQERRGSQGKIRSKKEVVGKRTHVVSYVDGIYASMTNRSHVQCRIEAKRSGNETEQVEKEEDVWRMRVDGQHGAARWTLTSGTEPGRGKLALDMAVLAPEDARGAQRVLEEDARAILQHVVRRAVEEAETSAETSVPGFARAAWKEPDPLQTTNAKPTTAKTQPEEHAASSGNEKGKGKQAGKKGNKGEVEPDVQVHLRRLDDATHLHRRAVASVRVRATRERAWNVLQDVSDWCRFVPGLVRSVRVPHGEEQEHKPNRTPNRRRRYQQTYRTHLVAVPLDARVQMDVVVKDPVEMQFRIKDISPEKGDDPRQVQGKWLIQPGDGMDEPGSPVMLKFAMEARMARPGAPHCKRRPVWNGEPLDEKVVYEDVPAMLLAFRDRIEAAEETRGGGPTRPGLADMKEDLEVLARELKRAFGETCGLPPRSDLRKARRTDLEKAIAHHGGAVKVAEATGMPLAYPARKPRGHWDRLDTVREEIEGFQWSHGLDPKVMPTRTEFQRKGRNDIARALERWGGGPALAQLLGLKAPQARAKSPWDLHLQRVARATGAKGVELFRIASKTYNGTPRRRPGADDPGAEEEAPSHGGRRSPASATGGD